MPYLPEAEQADVVASVVFVARHLLAQLTAASPEEEAESQRRMFEPSFDRRRARAATALAWFVPHLVETHGLDVKHKVLKCTRQLEDNYARASALAEISRHLPGGERETLQREALEAALRIEEDDRRADVLVDLLPRLSPLGRRIAHEAVAKTVPGASARQLAKLASFAPQEQAPTWVAGALERLKPADSYRLARAQTLVAFLPHHPSEERATRVKQALEAARAVPDRLLWMSNDVHPLARLASLAEGSDQTDLLDEALDRSVALPSPGARIRSLIELLPQLSSSQQDEVRNRVREDIEANRDPWRIEDLFALVPYLSPSQQESIITEVLERVDGGGIDELYSVLGSYSGLPTAHRNRVLRAVRRAIASIDDLLGAMGVILLLTPDRVLPHLSDSDCCSIAERALADVPKVVDSPAGSAKVLCSLLPYLSSKRRQEVLEEALEAARRYHNGNLWAVNTLLAILPKCTREEQDEVVGNYVRRLREPREPHVSVKHLRTFFILKALLDAGKVQLAEEVLLILMLSCSREPGDLLDSVCGLAPFSTIHPRLVGQVTDTVSESGHWIW